MEDAPLRDRRYPYRGEVPRATDDPERWLDDYDKILVEQAVMGELSLPGTVLRLPMVYGPGDLQHRLFPYVKRMADRRSCWTSGSRAWSSPAATSRMWPPRSRWP